MTSNAPSLARSSTDPRPAFFSSVATACDVVAGISPGQLHDPTPCSEFDVHALLGHLLAVFRRVSSLADGVPAVGHATPVTDVADDGWAEAAIAAARKLESAWADPAVLDLQMHLPFGTLPGAAALGMYTGEVSTHTWDLAVATGQFPAWDDEVLTGALNAAREKLPMASRPPEIPFSDAVPVPEDAPAIERLVAWQGRDPAWRPAA